MGREDVFHDILEQKKAFQAIKTRSSKSRKSDIFPKELTHGFGPKMAIFPNSFLQPIQARKRCFTIIYNEKTFFQAIKCLLRYSTTKNRLSFLRLFLGNIGQENVFYDILDQKKPFQAIKTRSSRSRKIDMFPKGLNHGFGPKIAFFGKFFFFCHYRPGKCLLRYFTTKKLLSRL